MTRTPNPTSSGQDELDRIFAEDESWRNDGARFFDPEVLIPKIRAYIAHYTQEAVEAARIDELERLYRVARRGDYYEAEIRDRLAELSAHPHLASTNQEVDHE